MQVNCVSRLCNGMLNGTAGGRATQNVRDGHPVEVRIVGFLDLDGELQTAGPDDGSIS